MAICTTVQLRGQSSNVKRNLEEGSICKNRAIFLVTWCLAQLNRTVFTPVTEPTTMKEQTHNHLTECVSVKWAVKLISRRVFHRPYCSYEATLHVRHTNQGERFKSQSPHLLVEILGKCYKGNTAAGDLKTLCQALPPSWSLCTAHVCEIDTSQFIPISWAAALEALPGPSYVWSTELTLWGLHCRGQTKMEKGLTPFALILPLLQIVISLFFMARYFL